MSQSVLRVVRLIVLLRGLDFRLVITSIQEVVVLSSFE